MKMVWTGTIDGGTFRVVVGPDGFFVEQREGDKLGNEKWVELAEAAY